MRRAIGGLLAVVLMGVFLPYGGACVEAMGSDLSMEWLGEWRVEGEPALLAIHEGSGTVFVTINNNHRVLGYDAEGELVAVLGRPGEIPAGLAVDAEGFVVVAVTINNNHRVIRYSTAGEVAGEWEGEGLPRGLAADGEGHVIVAVTINNNHRVVGYGLNGSLVADWEVEAADRVFGVAADRAGGIAVGVTINNNHRVVKYGFDGEPLASWVVSDGSGGQAGIAIGPDGVVFVTINNNHRVVAHAAHGAYLGTFGSEGTGPGEFRHPTGLAVSNAGLVYVADAGNRRVQFFRQGTARALRLSGDLGFGDVVVGQSAQRVLIIHNEGDAPRTVSSAEYPEGFGGDWDGGVIEGRSAWDVVVTFRPTEQKTYGGTVFVHCRESGEVATYPCSGAGTASEAPDGAGHGYGPTAGWYLVSVPTSGDAAAIFAVSLWFWNGTAYEAATGMEPSQGYWARLPASKTVSAYGTIPVADQTLVLGRPGWHMISAPWPYPKSVIQVTRGGGWMSWADAVAAGWVRNSIYGYKATDGAYTMPTTLDPWYGYWLDAKVSGMTLRFVYASRTTALGRLSEGPEPLVPLWVLPAELPPPPPVGATALGSIQFGNSPNPVTDVNTTTFRVVGPMAAWVTNIRVLVFDLSGKMVWQGSAAGAELAWHTDDLMGRYLANGVYVYQITAQVAGTTMTSGLIKLSILR